MSESEDGFRDDEIERLHLSRLSNYSVATVVSAATTTTGDDVIKSDFIVKTGGGSGDDASSSDRDSACMIKIEAEESMKHCSDSGRGDSGEEESILVLRTELIVGLISLNYLPKIERHLDLSVLQRTSIKYG